MKHAHNSPSASVHGRVFVGDLPAWIAPQRQPPAEKFSLWLLFMKARPARKCLNLLMGLCKALKLLGAELASRVKDASAVSKRTLATIGKTPNVKPGQ